MDFRPGAGLNRSYSEFRYGWDIYYPVCTADHCNGIFDKEKSQRSQFINYSSFHKYIPKYQIAVYVVVKKTFR